MHTVTELETNVPAFLGKLWKLVDDPESDDLIRWAPNGRSFFIKNTAQFARELLPHYYKHNNMASFVRQLNMYGFHKKVSVEVGGLKCDRDEMEFAHQYFIKDHPYLLEHIKRKIAASKTQDGHPPIKTEVMNKVLNEVRSMRGRQEHLDTRLGTMKRENEALWRELAMLRRKHLKQQEIVNKLIHFLVTLVQPSRTSSASRSVKRRYPLMIHAHQQDKQMKMGKADIPSTGPVIHELDPSEHENHEHDMDSEYIVADILDNHQTPAVESPQSTIDDTFDDEGTESAQYFDDTLTDKNDIYVLQTQTDPMQDTVSHKLKRKGRKNKVPIKILIPSMEGGEEAREEILMLEPDEMDQKKSKSKVSESKSKSSRQDLKRVPVKTVPSSKLAAMARNINKMKQLEVDLDSDEIEDDPELSSNQNTCDFDDMLIIPDVITTENEMLTSGVGALENTKQSNVSTTNNVIKNTDIVDDASSSSQSKDWSLSCINLSNMANNAVSRLGSKEEVGNHVVTVQSDLEQLRDTLLNEGYSIDANTLLGLFGNDDPMSFGIPINPELNPSHERTDDHINQMTDGATGGELMTYNPSTSLLDFDDDILLGVNDFNSGERGANDDVGTNYFSEDSMDMVDTKAKFLESLVSANDPNPSASS